ncbi:tRNA (5-methylaminomethyl-2-thiouridine)(34)-methyltransferase MnmD [Olivibacter sp. XZL3]|uniref:tRNA (5-methylaminomethyl-2-thiouridine)(34)-methyltransferase MnmD n=1 Tax=Olivibacter sp. XZL3 TaxID=1735116 RepID=UPI0010654CEA|nr:tRNA (5-methylaminomethyl-2-thiouridine)(34)-methyltransferase MnmD [Olivibacter sp. XZL3]
MNFVTTADGSKTIFHEAIGEHYHSKHGAVQESKHVFLSSGLKYFLEQTENRSTDSVSILEVGFGTGLNFLLTADYCYQKSLTLSYTGIEAFPLEPDMIKQTGYEKEVETTLWQSFSDQYTKALTTPQHLANGITWSIAHKRALDFDSQQRFDIIYFDAFAAVHQPEMWGLETLAHVCSFLNRGGVFVTYAITGNLKRIMKSIGFSIEKAPGAPGKREMLRAVKV